MVLVKCGFSRPANGPSNHTTLELIRVNPGTAWADLEIGWEAFQSVLHAVFRMKEPLNYETKYFLGMSEGDVASAAVISRDRGFVCIGFSQFWQVSEIPVDFVLTVIGPF